MFYSMATNRDVLQPHLMVGKGDVAEHVLIPGDPKRVELMATHLSNPVKVSENRLVCNCEWVL